MKRMKRAPPPLAETFVFVSTIVLKTTTSVNNVSEIWRFFRNFRHSCFCVQNTKLSHGTLCLLDLPLAGE